MSRSAASLTALRAKLLTLGPCAAVSGTLVQTGSPIVDARLGGGLARAALHELFADDGDYAGAAAGFALMLGLRARAGKPIIWVREDKGERGSGRLYGPGLVELGVDPADMFLVTGRDAAMVLRAGADSVGCGAVGAVVIETWGNAPALNLTASRLLALAAARSGVLTLVLRLGADPVPSAAATRWRIKAAPSSALVMAPAASAPGKPAFDINLLRHRGGIAGFEARVEWDRDRRSFSDAAGPGAALPGGVPAIAAGRTVADIGRRAA